MCVCSDATEYLELACLNQMQPHKHVIALMGFCLDFKIDPDDSAALSLLLSFESGGSVKDIVRGQGVAFGGCLRPALFTFTRRNNN